MTLSARREDNVRFIDVTMNGRSRHKERRDRYEVFRH